MERNKQDKAAELVKEFEAGVKDLVTGENWKRALDVASKFHHYSFGNQLLIAIQSPEASLVAGFKRWQEMGRYVRKGEKGIAILAPMKSTREVERDDGTTERVAFLRGFRVVHVFDVSQTEGEELPSIIAPKMLEGEAVEGTLQALETFAGSIGFPVSYEATPPGAYGFCQYDPPRIVVSPAPELSSAAVFSVLVHEVAHAILHASDREARTRGDREVEAESVAYVVRRALGGDVGECSFPYVATWAGGDVGRVTAAADRVVKCARQILEALDAQTETEVAA